MALTHAEKKLRRAFKSKPISEQQRLMIEAINREMDENDPEPELIVDSSAYPLQSTNLGQLVPDEEPEGFPAANLNVSPLALHICVINRSLWSMRA